MSFAQVGTPMYCVGVQIFLFSSALIFLFRFFIPIALLTNLLAKNAAYFWRVRAQAPEVLDGGRYNTSADVQVHFHFK